MAGQTTMGGDALAGMDFVTGNRSCIARLSRFRFKKTRAFMKALFYKQSH